MFWGWWVFRVSLENWLFQNAGYKNRLKISTWLEMNPRTVLLLIQHYLIYKRKCQLEYLFLHWLEKRKKRITYTHTSLNLKWYRATKLENIKRYYKFFWASSNSSYSLGWKKVRGSIHTHRQDDAWRALVVQGRHCRQQLLCHFYSQVPQVEG